MKFEFKYLKTYLLDIMVSFIVLLIPTLVYLVCIIILGNRVITLAIIIVVISLQIFMIILIVPFLFRDFKDKIPNLIVSFIITKEQFKILLCDKIYAQYFWTDIKEIQLYEEVFQEDFLSLRNKEKITIIKNDNNTENLRLYHYGFNRKTIEKIIYELKLYSDNFNISFVEFKVIEKGSSEERSDEFIKLKNSIKNIKNDLKLNEN